MNLIAFVCRMSGTRVCIIFLYKYGCVYICGAVNLCSIVYTRPDIYIACKYRKYVRYVIILLLHIYKYITNYIIRIKLICLYNNYCTTLCIYSDDHYFCFRNYEMSGTVELYFRPCRFV